MDTPEMTRHERRQKEREARAHEAHRSHKKGSAGKAIGLIIALCILGLIIWGITKNVGPSTPPEQLNAIRAEDHVKGPTDAAVTIIEYSDFQCPACGSYFPVVKKLLETFPKDVRVVYRHFPLTQIHLNAFDAATAAEAASVQGKFWEMHDILFARQNDWVNLAKTTTKFTEYAHELGLNEDQFKKDTKSIEVEKRINADQSIVRSLGVQSTPTFYMNNVKINNNPQSFEEFKTLVQSAITLANSQKPKEARYHAHADFRVIVNNQPFNFSPSKYQSSKQTKVLSETVHLHNNKGNVLHVHERGVTLGAFFKSVGFDLENTCLMLDTRAKYCSNGTDTLRLFVNGKEEINPPLYAPKDLDRILLVYGKETEEQLNALAKTVTDEACIYSEKCPERGKPPVEECVGGLGTDCE